VLAGGQLVEEGDHADLMALGGRYAEMFEMQAASYR
jgi:ATP-binding cassette subfamily B protein